MAKAKATAADFLSKMNLPADEPEVAPRLHFLFERPIVCLAVLG